MPSAAQANKVKRRAKPGRDMSVAEINKKFAAFAQRRGLYIGPLYNPGSRHKKGKA